MIARTHRGCALLVTTCLTLALVPRAAIANPNHMLVAPSKGVSPTVAADERKPVQEQARNMRLSGNPSAAGDLLAEEATRLKDPVLFLDAADAFKAAGEEARDVSSVQRATEQALIANDILQFLGDDRASSKWKPVSDDHRDALVSRAETLLAECEILIDEIEAEKAEPEPEPLEEEKQKRAKPGQIFIIAGAAALGLGVAGLGVGAAGIGIGASAQSNANDPTVYGKEWDDYDAKGHTGNLLAYVGLSVAAVGIGAGTALVIIGLKKKKAGGATAEDETIAKTLRVAPTAGGVVLSGRF